MSMSPGGCARIVALPADPESAVVPLDRETLAWLSEARVSPYGGPTVRWGSTQRATSGALVVGDRLGEEARWRRYLALHRHGGVEACYSHCVHAYREIRVFPLRHIVGLAWHVLALQKDACDCWGITAPFEVSVALQGTSGATLGSFAGGVRNPV